MRAEDLVGVWIIRSLLVEDCATGERMEPWGVLPFGTVMFHSEGRLFALIAPGDRSHPLAQADEAAAFRSMLAYSGRYRVEPPDCLVTTVDIAWFEPWVGSEQVRYCQMDDDSLTLTSAPLQMPKRDAAMYAVVTWKRERPASNQN